MKRLFVFIALLLFTSMNAQRKLQGTILDNPSNKPLEDVEVTVIGKKTVKTDKKGKFRIDVESPTDTILFQRKGYYSDMIEVGNAMKMKVLLSKVVKEEVVISDAYSNLSMRSNTAAVSVLDEKDFNKGAVNDIYQLLRGKIPGLRIEQNNASSTSEPTITIRGGGSFSGLYSPLIIVDGARGIPLSSIDPNEVKSVTLLKDGSAQAMYGMQAQGGVLLITTKSHRNKQ